MERITSIDQLRERCSTDEPEDFFISLAGGIAKSSKSIMLTDEGEFNIIHEIDDTEETLDEDELAGSNIGEAITKGAFYSY